jgi:hypothetical protein
MPKYTINGIVFNSATALSDADLEELAGTTQPKAPLPVQTGEATPESMVADPSNPFSYLGQEQQTAQGPAMQAVGQGVNRALQVGAGIAKGAVINPVAAVAQVAGGETGRQFASEAQKAYAQQRAAAGATGFDFAELGGAVTSPINRFIPGGGYTAGAIGAATQPLEGEYTNTFDVLVDKAKQMAGGAVLGKFTDNIIAGLTPKLKEGARELMDKGIPVSPGQAYEGAPGWLFRQIESFGLGPKADKVNKAFNPTIADEVLSSIGQEIPKAVAPGQASVRLVQRRISNFYTESLNNLGKNALDLEYKQGVQTAIKNATDTLSNPQEKDFIVKKLTNSLNLNIGNKIDKDGNIDGKDLKKIQTWLEAEVEKVKDKTGAIPEALKSGYGDVLANLNQYISRIDKDGNIAKADEAWAKLYSFADASSKAVTKGGVFNPEQLAQATISQAKTTLTSGGGRAPLNDQAQRALHILGKQDPANWLSKVMIASKVGTGFATTYMMPQIAIPILSASGLSYLAAKQLMQNPSAARLAIKKALEDNTARFGAVGADIYNQIKSEVAQTQ